MNPDLNQLLLPFAEREYIDVKRTARILCVTHTTVHSFYAKGYIEMLDYAKRKFKRVRYASVVAFCDRIRERYGIRDRRPKLTSEYLRHRDCDLLPFPLEDTIRVEDAAAIFGYASRSPIYLMIEEGRFDAYQFTTTHPWRISRSSLALYVQSIRDRERIVPVAAMNRISEEAWKPQI